MLGDQATPPGVTRGSYLAVTFEHPPLTIRYLGGGLDGLVVDRHLPHVEWFRVAAVLAWQWAHERVLPPPPPRGRGGGESESSVSRSESRARLRATVAELLRDMVAIGISHLSPAILDRLTTAATWAIVTRPERAKLAVACVFAPPQNPHKSGLTLTTKTCSSVLPLGPDSHSLISLPCPKLPGRWNACEPPRYAYPGELNSADFAWRRRVPESLDKNTSITK
jgi:hypothetical protein